jgi:hypothetical protein
MSCHLRLAIGLATALFGAGMAAAQTTPTEPPAPGAVPAAPVAAAAAGPATGGQPLPSARWTAAQIRQSFNAADANGDGQLTRAEAQRLSVMPHSFEDMDQNKDGAVTRAEYEASFYQH